MRYRIVLCVSAALGCSATEVPPDTASDRAIRVRVDSLSAEGERLRASRAVALLAEPPDFTGRIIRMSEGGASYRGIEVELDSPAAESPRLGSGHLAFVLWRNGAWKIGGKPLPLDSLRVGDRVRLWLQDGVAIQPTDPPVVSIAALQRVDSLR